ncbi:MAG: LLM class flavin-dependent oxidoreductase [Dehalococcoidia bacterium]
MRLSLFYELGAEDPSDPHLLRQRFEEAIEQVVLADQLGFDTVWAVEHHFLPGYSSMSCPELFLTALARHTKDIRLGHGIVHLPYRINNPIRVAERIATLDLLSGGRVEFGGGRAQSHEELAGFSVDPAETQAQWAEALQIIPRMWTEDLFEYQSDLISIPPRCVTPKPLQVPHPPMWVASTQPASVEFAASQGLGILAFGVSGLNSLDLVQLYREKVRDARPVSGHVNDQFALMRIALCLPTDDEALRAQEYDYWLFNRHVAELFRPWVEGEVPPSFEYLVESHRRAAAGASKYSLEQLVEMDQACIGSPDTCVRVLNDLAAKGVDEVMLFLQGARTPHELILESLRLFASEVMPRLEPTRRDTAAASVS